MSNKKDWPFPFTEKQMHDWFQESTIYHHIEEDGGHLFKRINYIADKAWLDGKATYERLEATAGTIGHLREVEPTLAYEPGTVDPELVRRALQDVQLKDGFGRGKVVPVWSILIAAARYAIEDLQAEVRRSAVPSGMSIVPTAALREVIRISDRDHEAWDAVKAALATKENS